MFQSIGAALGQPAKNPDRQPVRRHSHMVGRCEAGFWRPTDRRQVQRIVLAAKIYERAGRQPGRRNGPLNHVAIEILELLASLVSFKTGRLEPCIAYIMGKLRRSRDAVVRALAMLQEHGFLDRLRRYEPTQREGRGPRIRQMSNAYKLTMPPRALRLLGVHGQDVPLPDDMKHGLEARRQEIEGFKAALPLDELAIHEAGDGRLGQMLAQLGLRVQERESVRQEESQARVIL